MNVSRETTDRLHAYLDLLTTWSGAINLVAKGTIQDAWDRHIMDSLQLIDLRPAPGPLWADLGSGGGLPGIVIAIAAPWQDCEMVLLEADQRKATFLRHVVRTLDIPRTTVQCARIEAAPALGAATVTARALAPLPKLMAYVAAHMGGGGAAFLPKGRSWRDEVALARQDWQFDLTVHPSQTQPEAAVLEIRDIHVR